MRRPPSPQKVQMLGQSRPGQGRHLFPDLPHRLGAVPQGAQNEKPVFIGQPPQKLRHLAGLFLQPPAHGWAFPAFARQISWVMVPMGQKTHQERGIHSTMAMKPMRVEVSIKE